MSSTESLTATFDGTTPVERYIENNSVPWFTGGTPTFLGYYSAFHPGSDLATVTFELTGSDWRIKTMRASGENVALTVTDLDDGADRRIAYLELGENAVVNLTSTAVMFMQGGWGELLDVTLGDSQIDTTQSIFLYSEENRLTTGNAWVESIQTGWFGDPAEAVGDTINIGSGGAGGISTGVGDDTITTSTGWVGSINTRDGDDVVTIGSGAADFIRTGNGDDEVDATGGWVGVIVTGEGDDLVLLGSTLGETLVRLGGGDDTVRLAELSPDFGVLTYGGSGVDTINFDGFSAGVTFSLNELGAFQNVTDPGGAAGLGWFAEIGIENIIGTAQGDVLTGDSNDNVLTGQGGADLLFGGKGNDWLLGGAGNDLLFGGNGKDNLIGGNGNDELAGGKGKDFLRGNGGDDVFVFGANSGTDKVKDFTDGSDILRLDGPDSDVLDLTISNQGSNRKIEYDGGVILLLGKADLILTNADFDFV